MGLDIYAGTLIRYYSRNWKTTAQKWAEENGVKLTIVRAVDSEIAPVEDITAGVTGWRDQLIQELSDRMAGQPYWNEDNDITPYYTDKPDWDAVHALMLYTACKLQGKKVPNMLSRYYGRQSNIQ